MRAFVRMTERHWLPLVATLLAVLTCRFRNELAPLPWRETMLLLAAGALVIAYLVRWTTYARNFIERPLYDAAIVTPCWMGMLGTLVVVCV